MEWADESLVLKYLRMMPERQARARRFFAAASAGVATGLVAAAHPVAATVSVAAWLGYATYVAASMLYPTDPWLRLPKHLRNRPEQSAADINEEIPLHMRQEPISTSFWSTARGAIVSKAAVATSIAGIFAAMAADLPWLPRSVFACILGSVSASYAIRQALDWIEAYKFADWPRNSKERNMLRFYCQLSSSKNFYYIGEIKGQAIGLPRMLRFMHTLIGGPTGEGKSTALIIPALLCDGSASGSGIVPDMKSPDLFNTVAGQWLKNNKRAYLFDPWHPDCIGLEPLEGADDDALLVIVDVLMREQQEKLVEDPFFTSRTRYLLFGILKLVQTFDAPYCNLASAYHCVDSVERLKTLVDSSGDDVRILFSDFLGLTKETQINAVTSIKQKLDIFMDPDVRRAFSRNEFRLDMLFNEGEPCLFVIGAPVNKKTQGTKIASLLVNIIVNLAFRERRAYKIAQQRGEKTFEINDLYLYLDEMRNLKVTQFADLVSIARETKTHIIASVTDLLFFKFYRNDYDAIIGNLRTRLFLRGLPPNSAREVSDALGEVNDLTYSLLPTGVMARQERRSLLAPDQVMNLQDPDMICFTPVTPPFIAQLTRYHESPFLSSLVVAPPKSMRPLYAKWGVGATEPLFDSPLPLKAGVYDLEAIRGGKPPAEVKTNITLETFIEQGNGVFSRPLPNDVFEIGQNETHLRRGDDLDAVVSQT